MFCTKCGKDCKEIELVEVGTITSEPLGSTIYVSDCCHAIMSDDGSEPSTQVNYTKLDTLLEEVGVAEPGCWGNSLSDTILKDWFAVTDDTGIIAYFHKEVDAFRFRLDLINRKLNP